MIHLDANLLIAAVNPADTHHATVGRVTAQPAPCGCSSVAWMEFHSKTVDPVREKVLRKALAGGILPFDEAAAKLASQLFHLTGAKRQTRLDTMIAATAILGGAELATVNPADFQPFEAHGLKLFSLETPPSDSP
ncbi:MAG: PIN domain-containing protein [Verrucomicrobiae bacterium]|nr:PIN domain-containing protein [Verrucomicrobiae bacterium]